MGYPPNPQHQFYSVLMRYSEGDTYELLPERKDPNEFAKFLNHPTGRMKYLAWQKEHNHTWKLLNAAPGRLASLACKQCKGTGQVALFTSLSECPGCHMMSWEERDRREMSLDEWDEEVRPFVKARRIVGSYINTHQGRKLLAEALETVMVRGCLPTPLRMRERAA